MVDVSHESETGGLHRGLINATAPALILWGAIIGALIWAVG